MKLAEKLSFPLVCALLLLSLSSFAVLRSQGATISGNELSYPKAVFAVCNAVSLSGFQLTVNVTDYKEPGQMAVLVLIVMSSLVNLLVGGWALVRILKLPFSDGQVLKGTFIAYGLVLVLGANFLMDSGSGLRGAIFNLASAFGNSGHWIGLLPAAENWRVHFLLLPIALIGGLGIPVLLDLLISPFHKRPIHSHTYAVLVSTAVIYVTSVLLIFGLDWSMEVDTKTAITSAATEAINGRTYGLPLGTFDAVSRPSQWIILILMLIGASPAGTGGGLKTTTAYLLLRDPIRLLRGRAITPALGFAILWLLIYCLAGFISTLLLIWTHPQVQSDRLLFLAASALSNCGTSQGPVLLGADGLYILSGTMVFGRFAPLLMLWWAAKAEPGRVDVAVG